MSALEAERLLAAARAARVKVRSTPCNDRLARGCAPPSADVRRRALGVIEADAGEDDDADT